MGTPSAQGPFDAGLGACMYDLPLVTPPPAHLMQVSDESGRSSLNFQQESDIDSNLAMLVLLLKPHNYSDVVR